MYENQRTSSFLQPPVNIHVRPDPSGRQNATDGGTQWEVHRELDKTYDRRQYEEPGLRKGRAEGSSRTSRIIAAQSAGQTRYHQAEVMLSAKEQRATEIIIYELRKWDDESHTDCQ